MVTNDILYVAFIYLSSTDGIAKKIISQAKGFSKLGGKCSLLCCEDNNIVHLEFVNGEVTKKTIKSKVNNMDSSSRERVMSIHELIRVAYKLIENKRMNIYIRHMIPTSEFIGFLRHAKKMGHKVGYEIPTYPYFYEQFNVAHNKGKAVFKILNDMIFWPFIYRYVDKIFTIVSNSKVKVFRKMHLITNGVELEEEFKYIKRTINDSSFNMIGVGTIWPYHGYERVIAAIEECGGRLKNGLKVRFHIVGESKELSRLKEICENKHLMNHVIFHGKKFGSELNVIYEDSHIGVGTLALKKRNADIDTAIKNIEYFSKALPVISSGKIFNVSLDSGLVYISKDNSNLDLNDVFKFYQSFDSNVTKNIFSEIISTFTWDSITADIYRQLNDN
ncbi:glycosyltransferase [Pontibacillus sp. HMF3514]|uniref:glycosyltransferase n=1 Tax=Pontibacillus sp. HMF3514 TaxID=2692425 RepID=UPI00131F931E|nr:glycosyltransferase [Pontibacillus sp. HMF3514]QHE53728.1 glycosyltransferase [Pontibacillus sp. HMF3514]